MTTKTKIQEKKKLSSVDENISKLFDIKKRLGKGAYGIVWKALDRRTNETLAVKKIFDAFRDETDAQRTFREICFLQSFRSHPNVVRLLNVYRASNNLDIYLVFEYMESDLHNIIKKGTILKDIHKRFVMYQLLNAVRYIHSGNVIHRDLKPSNILIDSKCRCKLADFGLARSLSIPPVKQTTTNEIQPLLTDYVATRWYRAPEILVASKRYTKGIDMWSLGCILGEMIRGKPLFQGSSTINQIEKIISALPNITEREINAIGASFGSVLLSKQSFTEKKTTLEELVPDAPADALDMIKSLLLLDPLERRTATEALEHPYVGRFRHSVPEEELEEDILPPFRDDIRLTVSEYRTKLYEIAQSAGDKSQTSVNNNLKRLACTTTKRSIPQEPVPAPAPLLVPASTLSSALGPPTKQRETKYLERTVNEHPQIVKKPSKQSLNRVSNTVSSTTLIEESLNPPNPVRKNTKQVMHMQFETSKVPSRNRIIEDLRNVSITQPNPSLEKKIQPSKNRVPSRTEYQNVDKRNSIDGGYGSLPVDTGSSDKTPKAVSRTKIFKSSSSSKITQSDSYNHFSYQLQQEQQHQQQQQRQQGHYQQHPQRVEKSKPPTPKPTIKPENFQKLQRSSSAIIVKTPHCINNSMLNASTSHNKDPYESANFCYDARIKKIEAAVAGFKDDIQKFAKESKYRGRPATPTRSVPNVPIQYQQPPTRYPQVRSKYTGGNTINTTQSVSSSKMTPAMHHIVPAEGNNISNASVISKRNSMAFPTLQRERIDFSSSLHHTHTGGSGDHLGRNHTAPLEPGKSNDRYKYSSKTQHHILQQQPQQQQSRNRISSKVI